ncbi:uncharacterized protein LOC127797817 [Diospyros lotus]|uniref:uncharacterized protein LOC127797817 n=1 Tax=Diospyros lotus TaxID=55363 RepID=UPI0022548D59|nr:uncharacterized protein LOC127797817 [Diospyros lotus]
MSSHIPESNSANDQTLNLSTMSSQVPESEPTGEQSPAQKPSDQPPMDDPGALESREGEEGEGEEEEEGECGFCLFMKGGGCRESFISWENCIEEAEKSQEDIVDKCFEVTAALKKCMEAHSDYYAPILQAEKAAEAEAVKELQKEKARDAVNEGS